MIYECWFVFYIIKENKRKTKPACRHSHSIYLCGTNLKSNQLSVAFQNHFQKAWKRFHMSRCCFVFSTSFVSRFSNMMHFILNNNWELLSLENVLVYLVWMSSTMGIFTWTIRSTEENCQHFASRWSSTASWMRSQQNKNSSTGTSKYEFNPMTFYSSANRLSMMTLFGLNSSTFQSMTLCIAGGYGSLWHCIQWCHFLRFIDH